MSFDFAISAFLDPRAIEWVEEGEDDEEEDNPFLLGMAGDVLVLIVYADLGDRTRIFGARRANRDERNYYFGQNAP